MAEDSPGTGVIDGYELLCECSYSLSHLSRPSPNTHTCMHTHARMCMHTHMHTHMHVRIHMHAHAYTHMHMHAYTHAHTLVHSQAGSLTHARTSALPSEQLSLLLVSSFSSASCNEETFGNERRKRSRSKHREGCSEQTQYSLWLQVKAHC